MVAELGLPVARGRRGGTGEPQVPAAAEPDPRRAQRGADHPSRARLDARRAARGPRAHRAREGAAPVPGRLPARVQERADRGRRRVRLHVRGADLGGRRDRDRVLAAGRRAARRAIDPAPRLPRHPGRAARDRRAVSGREPAWWISPTAGWTRACRSRERPARCGRGDAAARRRRNRGALRASRPVPRPPRRVRRLPVARPGRVVRRVRAVSRAVRSARDRSRSHG